MASTPPSSPVPLSQRHPSSAPPPAARQGAASGVPLLLLALPLTLSTLVLVLFAVVINRQQEQGQQLAVLQQRVQALENSRALERTTVLEEQLRVMLNRLQAMEKGALVLQALQGQQQQLQQDLQRLRSSLLTRSNDLGDLPAEMLPPQRPGRPTPPAGRQIRPPVAPPPVSPTSP